MPTSPPVLTPIRCRCGKVEFVASGPPIVTAVCYCGDCQEGGRRIQAQPGAPVVMEPCGGTPYVLFRKDRLHSRRGGELLQNHKLKTSSATNRVIATCCNSGLMLSFDSGPHWYSVYRDRIATEPPRIEMRLNTRSAPDVALIPRDAPRHGGASLSFIWKLMAARLAMALRR